ncbi:MAG: DoxX family protein [Mesorhizobium sp.]|nr:DoxX family protein [Mesorhizobium sp.]
MTDSSTSAAPAGSGFFGVVRRGEALIASIPEALSLLALRIALAVPFYKSGLTKWDGFLTLSNGARYLFTQEFRLHIFGAQYAYPAPILMATLSGIAEIVLPVLLVLGLFTRFAAVALLGMIAVIQLTVPEGWANFHLPWAAMALALAVYGGGQLSLDRLIGLGTRKD